MKRLIGIFFLVVALQEIYAQHKPIQRDELLFEQGCLLQEMVIEELELEDIIQSEKTDSLSRELAIEIKETMLEKSLQYYQELIDSFPQSKLRFRALNNKGGIELALNERKDAIETFKAILNSEADDKEKGGIGSGIMSEPFANYKNRAAKTLAHVFLEDSNYQEAITYLDLTTKYPYRHFCGNEYASDDLYMAWLYARCYIGLDKPKQALEKLLPHIIENGLADNSEIVALAYQVLIKEYKKEFILRKYEEAFKNYRVEQKKIGNSSREEFYIIFLDTEIKLNSWQLDFIKPEEQQKTIDKVCKNSELYKLLTK